jgi:hypothetical protein
MLKIQSLVRRAPADMAESEAVFGVLDYEGLEGGSGVGEGSPLQALTFGYPEPQQAEQGRWEPPPQRLVLASQGLGVGEMEMEMEMRYGEQEEQ